MNIGALPATSRVRFPARRLANARIAYRSPGFDWSDQAILNTFAYTAPCDLLADDDLASDEAVFEADRYGGPVGIHGGSGRCGFRDELQVKGIGRTPLLGRDAERVAFWHSHGGMALSDALQEALWSRLFQAALPYGAVDTLAVIATGTQCHFETEIGVKGLAPRGLVVREAPVRPVHFDRAAYFRLDSGTHPSDDVSRIKAALAVFPQFLPSLDSYADTHVARVDALRAGFDALLKRWAEQIATAQALRLAHGAMNSSSICMDGRYIDFGTASFRPDYAPSRSYRLPPHLPHLWEEHVHLIAGLSDLIRWVNRFPSANEDAPLLDWTASRMVFLTAHQDALITALLKAAGFPESLIRPSSNHRDVAALGARLLKMTQDPGQARHDYVETREGRHHVAEAIQRAAERMTEQALGTPTPLDSPDSDFDHIYGAAYTHLEHQARRDRVMPGNFARMVSIQVAKGAVQRLSWGRSAVQQTCRQWAASYVADPDTGSALSSHISHEADIAETLFSPIRDYRVLLHAAGGRRYEFDARSGQVVSAEATGSDDQDAENALDRSGRLLNLPLAELLRHQVAV